MLHVSMTRIGLNLIMLALPVFAQETQPAPTEEPGTIKVIQLNHLDAGQAAEAIRAIGLSLRVFPVDGNRLIVQGWPEEVERLASQVIPALDLPQAAAGTKTQTHLIPLSVEPTGALINLLDTATAGSRSRFAMDQANRLLVVNTVPDALESIRKVVGQLDRVMPSMSMSFYFIRGSIASEDHGQGGSLPKNLAPVQKALQESGLGYLSLIAPLVVRTDSHEPFESQAVKAQHAPEADTKESLQFQVQGRAVLQPDGKSVQLDLRASMTGGYTRGDDDARQAKFALDSTITAKLGDYVVLAASPSTTADGDAIALAVRVTTD